MKPPSQGVKARWVQQRIAIVLFGVVAVAGFTIGSVKASTLTVTAVAPPAVFHAPVANPSILPTLTPTPSAVVVTPTPVASDSVTPTASSTPTIAEDHVAASASPQPSSAEPSTTHPSPSSTPTAATPPAACADREIQPAVLKELDLPQASLCLSDLKVRDTAADVDLEWKVATTDATEGHPARIAVFSDTSGSQLLALLAEPRPFTLRASSSTGDPITVAHFTDANTAAVVTAELIGKPPADHDQWVVIWE